MAEELTGLKRNHNRMSQDGKICNGSLIPAVDSMAYASAIWTNTMKKVTSCVYMIRAHIFVLYLFNRQVTWRIKGRQIGFRRWWR